MSYGTPYITTPIKKPVRVGRTYQMSKTNNNISAPEPVKPVKKYAKTRGEHFKDLVIVALITSIIAFIGGMQFSKNNQAQIDRAVRAAQSTAQAESVKK